MSSIGGVGSNPAQFNPINQTTGQGSSGHVAGTSGTSTPSSGVSGHSSPLPPIMQELQALMTEFSALSFAPTSSTPSVSNPTGKSDDADAKVGGHHHAGGKGGARESGGTTETIESLVTALWNSTDGTVDQLAKVVIEQATEQSQEAQQQALADSNAAKADLLAQAGQLRKEANDMRASAVVSLVMTVIASAVAIGGSLKSMNMSRKSDDILDHAETQNAKVDEFAKLKGSEGASKLQDPGPKIDLNVANTKAGNEGARANATGQIAQAVSGVINGLGTFASTMMQADQKDIEAEGDEDAAQAQDLNTRAQMEQKITDDMNKLVDQITDLIKEMGDAKAQMMQSMTRV